MNKLLHSLFGIETEETKPVGLIFLIGFAWGSSQMFSYTSASTIFIQRYGAENLAYAFIINAVLAPLAGFIILKLSQNFSFSKYFTVTIAFYCFILSFIVISLSFFTFRLPSMAYMLWIDIEYAISNVLFMSLVNKLFNIRQSKRLYGICIYGIEISAILAGISIPFIVRFTGALNLTYFAILFDFLSIFIFLWILRSFPNKIRVGDISIKSGDEEQTPISNLFSQLKNKYFIAIFTITALAAVATCFMENAYFSQLQSYLVDEVKVASYLSFLSMISSVLVLITNGFITGKFMKTFGLPAGLIVNPLVIGVIALMFLVFSNFAISAVLIFALVITLRVTHNVLFYSLHTTAYFNSFQILPVKFKDGAINFSETFIVNISNGVAGLALLILAKLLNADSTILILGVLIIVFPWLFMCYYFGKQYKSNLSNAVKNKILHKSDISLNDQSIINILVSNLSSSNPQEVMYSIDMLKKVHYPNLKIYAKELVYHQDAVIRRKAAGIYEKYGDTSDVKFITDRLEAELNPQVKAIWIRALAMVSDGILMKTVESYLKSKEPVVVVGTYIALMRYCGIEGMICVNGELMLLSKSEKSHERKFAAVAIGEIGSNNLFRILYPLLHDDDIDVRKAAIVAAGCLKSPKFIPLLVDNSDNISLRYEVMKALISISDKAIPSLEEIYEASHDKQKFVVYLYGRIRSREAARNLKAKLDVPDRELLGMVVESLVACRYSPSASEIEILNKRLTEAFHYSASLLCAVLDIGKNERDYIILEALKFERIQNIELIFSLLTLIYNNPHIRDIQFNYLHSGSEEKSAISIEFLDNILHKKHKSFVLPLLESSNTLNSIKILKNTFHDLELFGREKRLNEFLINRKIWYDEWLRSVVYYTMLREAKEEEKGSIIRKLEEHKEFDVIEAITPNDPGNDYCLIDKVIILKKAEIFSSIPDEIIAEIGKLTKIIEYNTGDLIIRKGDEGSTLYLIADGSVKVYNEEKELARLEKGAIFGELSALSPEPRTAFISALTKSQILTLSKEALNSLIDEQIEVSIGIIKILCQRIRNTLEHLVTDTDDTVEVPSDICQTALEHIADNYLEDKDLTDIEKVIIFYTVSIFNKLPHHVLRDIASVSSEKRLLPGETLFKKGDHGTSMFIIVKGEVTVTDKENLIATLGERKIIGEMAALSSETRTATITATKNTLLLKLNQDSLYEVMWDYREVAKEIIQVLIERLRNLLTS